MLKCFNKLIADWLNISNTCIHLLLLFSKATLSSFIILFLCFFYFITNLSKNKAKGVYPNQTLSFNILNLLIQVNNEFNDKSGFIIKKCNEVYPFREI